MNIKVYIFSLLFLFSGPSFAYLDPGGWGSIIGIVVASISAFIFTVKNYISGLFQKIKKIFRK